MKKGKGIAAIVVIAVIGLGGYYLYSHFVGNVDVVVSPQVEAESMSTEQEDAIVNEILFGEKNEKEESETNYDLDAQIASMADVQVKGKYKKNDQTVVCEITAPDVYSYMMNNVDELNKLETKELYENILAYAKSEDCAKRTVEVEVPATYEDGKLVIDTNSVKYQDAVNGGMNSALTELYMKVIDEMGQMNEGD